MSDQAESDQLASTVMMKAARAFDAGDIGVTDDPDIGLFMKRARVLNEICGDANFDRERLAVERFGLK